MTVHDVLARLETDRRSGRLSTVLHLDLDHHRRLMRSVGPERAQRAVDEIRQLAEGSLQAGDLAAPLAADQVLMVLNASNPEVAVRRAEALCSAVRHIELEAPLPAPLSLSVGIALSDGVTRPEELLAHADLACSLAKGRGGGCAVVFDEIHGASATLRQEFAWSLRLEDALREGRMEVWFQPMVTLGTREPVFYEALLRMRTPECGIVMPGDFLPAAERFGTIRLIDRFVLHEAVRQLTARPEIGLSVNVSGKTLGEEGFEQEIVDLVRASGVRANRLMFEITETALVPDLSRVRGVLTRLREQGFLFALDDFGCGFSSLTYLREFPVDFLKIDGSFVRDIESDRFDRELVASLVRLAKMTGRQTVAEHVETPPQRKALCDLGVDLGQGFLFGRPEPWASPAPALA